MQDTVYFEAGSEIDKADRALAQAAHQYHSAKTPEAKLALRQHLRLCAILFAASAQELLPKVDR